MILSIVWTYAIFSFRTVIPMAVLPFLSHLVGAEGTGVILACQALGLVGGVIVQFGFHQSAARELSISGNPDETSVIVSRVLVAQLITCVGATVLTGYAALQTPAIMGVPAGIVGVVLITIGTGLSPAWYFRGTGRPATGVMIEVAGQLVALALILTFVRSPDDTSEALLFTGFGPLAFSFLAIVWTIYEVKPSRLPPLKGVTSRLVASFPLFLVRLSSTGFTMSAAWIASLLTSPRETAYFGVAAKIASALTTFSQPVLFSLLPVIARAATVSRGSALRISARWGGALVLLGILAVIGVYIFADIFVGLLFAADMAPAADITKALAWICIVAALRDTLGDLILVPLQRDKTVAVCVVLGSGLGVGTAFLLAPEHGAYGMVWARLFGEAAVVTLLALSLTWFLVRGART